MHILIQIFEKYIYCLNYLCGFVGQPNTSDIQYIVLGVQDQVRSSFERCNVVQDDMCLDNSSFRDPFSWKDLDVSSLKCMNDAIDAILNGLVSPEHHGKEVMIPYVLIIILLCVIGFVGNMLTIIVILSTKSMRNSINYYLLSLAFSDLVLVTLTGPREVFAALHYRPWIFGKFFCTGHYYIIEAATYCTIMSITAVTVERYVAICHPIKAKSILLPNRMQKIIIPIWTISYAISVPLLFAYNIETFIPGVPESTVCTYQFNMQSMITNFNVLSSIFLFLLPMSIITVLYTLIARALNGNDMNVNLRRSSASKPSNKIKLKNRIHNDDDDDKVDVLRRQVVKLLAIVAVCFAVCWFPYHLIRLMPLVGYESWSANLLHIYHKYLYFISISFLYISAAINPILYNMMSKKFRQAFLRVVYGRCYQPARRQRFNSLTRATHMSSITPPGSN